VAGVQNDAEALREEAAAVLSTMGLRLSPEKTLITHIDEGLDFLGWRIQRHRKRGADRDYVYTYPAKKALCAVMAKVKTACRAMDTNVPLDTLLIQLNRILRGWCVYFRPGVSSNTFGYLTSFVWHQVVKWLLRKHRRIGWKRLRRRYFSHGWWPTTNSRRLLTPAKCAPRATATGEQPSPRHGQQRDKEPHQTRTGHAESPVRGRLARRVRERGPGKPTGGNTGRAPRADLTSSCPRSAPRLRWPNCSAPRSRNAPWRR
jgi:hypothetical protein